MKAIDVLKTLDNLFLDCHYPLRHVVLNPSKNSNYTVGALIKDTLKEDAVLTSAMHSDGEGCIHCDSGEDIPSAFNYCPYCNKKLRRR